jgi:hypothetical protein
MCSIVNKLLVLALAVCVLGSVSPALADTAVFQIGYSHDGQAWTYYLVEVPDDDYITVIWNGQNTYLWGPNFDPIGLPAQTGTVCNCTIGTRWQCPCNNHCAKLEDTDKDWVRGSCN